MDDNIFSNRVDDVVQYKYKNLYVDEEGEEIPTWVKYLPKSLDKANSINTNSLNEEPNEEAKRRMKTNKIPVSCNQFSETRKRSNRNIKRTASNKNSDKTHALKASTSSSSSSSLILLSNKRSNKIRSKPVTINEIDTLMNISKIIK